MSAYAAFRRQPVNPQVAQSLRSITIPAPTRGLILSENDAFMQPGGSVVQENWATTMKGVKLRGGYVRWCDLHALDGRPDPLLVAGRISTLTFYPTEQHRARHRRRLHLEDDWRSVHARRPMMTFAEYRAVTPALWVVAPPLTGTPLPDDDPARLPVVSAFEYVGDAGTERMYAANATKLFDVTTGTPSLIKSGQASGNYCRRADEQQCRRQLHDRGQRRRRLRAAHR